MRVLAVHNYYQQPGGEDRIFEAESSMLEKHGCRVFNYTVHNDILKGKKFLSITRASLWNNTIFNQFRKNIKQNKPDVIHFHNTFPLISPAAYYLSKIESKPIIQTLHNYRLLCPNALFFRNGHVCEDCMGKVVPWPSLIHACYRNSRAATSATAVMLSVYRALHTYKRMVDVYIAVTEFARKKFIQGGIPSEKIITKPNFIDSDSGIGNGSGRYALFVGRLASEKGINILLSAWEKISSKIPLKVVGDGPLSLYIADAVRRNSIITWLGQQPKHNILSLMKGASVLIFPSICYEGLPMTIVEAYSVGLPVIASKLGSMSNLIDHRRTGLHFNPSDTDDLARQMDWIVSHPSELARMRHAARAEYKAKYTAEKNYEILMGIYETAIERSRKKPAIQI